MCWFGSSCSFTELLLSQEICAGDVAVFHLRSCYLQENVLHGTCGLFTGLLFTGNMCFCGNIVSFTELLFTG
jgi:hypothetical protein